MQGTDYNELIQAGLRRKLTPEEEARLLAYFADHPEAQAAWDEEMSLNHLLRRLPDAPLGSNFTSQVLLLVERESRKGPRPAFLRWWRPFVSLGWAPRVALASMALCLGGFSYSQYQRYVRHEVAHSVATLSKSLPTVEMLENFEAIRRLNEAPQKVDIELLAALQ